MLELFLFLAFSLFGLTADVAAPAQPDAAQAIGAPHRIHNRFPKPDVRPDVPRPRRGF